MPINRLSCGEVFQRLDDFLDRELSDEEMLLVQEHLDTCLMCADEHRFERAILDGVKDKVRRLAIPQHLAARVRSALGRAQSGTSL